MPTELQYYKNLLDLKEYGRLTRSLPGEIFDVAAVLGLERILGGEAEAEWTT